VPRSAELTLVGARGTGHTAGDVDDESDVAPIDALVEVGTTAASTV
jgi:hypothetical protein